VCFLCAPPSSCLVMEEGELGNQIASCAPLPSSESSLLTSLLIYSKKRRPCWFCWQLGDDFQNETFFIPLSLMWCMKTDARRSQVQGCTTKAFRNHFYALRIWHLTCYKYLLSSVHGCPWFSPKFSAYTLLKVQPERKSQGKCGSQVQIFLINTKFSN